MVRYPRGFANEDQMMPDRTYFFAACAPISLGIIAVVHLVLLGFEVSAFNA